MIECYTREYRKARKEHKCECCGRIIRKGKKYYYETGKYDGEFFATALCYACSKMVDEYIKCTENEEYNWSDVTGFVREKHCDSCKYNDICIQDPHECDIIAQFYQEDKE